MLSSQDVDKHDSQQGTVSTSSELETFQTVGLLSIVSIEHMLEPSPSIKPAF